MKQARAILVTALIGLSIGASALAFQPPAPQNDFVPVTEAQRAVETLPAAPLLIAAYAFVWVALLGYLWFLWGRLKKVQGEIEALERRTGRREPGK